ncbi:MAG: peptidase M14 [Bacteroidetes bacterium]|nr:peptidase M14 [Fibrella sp.]
MRIPPYLPLCLFLCMIAANTSGQDSTSALARRLHDAHDTFAERELTHRRFKHKDIVPLIDTLRTNPLFSVSQLGESVEKRPIFQVKAGNGPIPVLLWSQMHGDEATATMALFDIFNFLKASNDGFDSLRHTLLTKTTLYFVPMLNPDGAERFQRRNALDIDLNRDALRLQSPESVLLKRLQQTLKPFVGFNLHDQNPRYSVGRTGQQATLSFLATAYDKGRHINDVRKRSMQLIVGMNRALQPIIPGRIGRYDDEFEPRAFGDNIQKWGTTLVLIESGGYPDDTEKQYIRKLNVVAILTALKAIVDGSYAQEDIADYQAIPENGRPFFDLLIRNAQIMRNGKSYKVDIGINRYEVTNKTTAHFSYRSEIEDLGDLSTFHGVEELDATGLRLKPVGVYGRPINSVADLDTIDLASLRGLGIVAFRMKQRTDESFQNRLVHVLDEGELPADPLKIGQTPTFALWENDHIKYVFVNGFK